VEFTSKGLLAATAQDEAGEAMRYVCRTVVNVTERKYGLESFFGEWRAALTEGGVKGRT